MKFCPNCGRRLKLTGQLLKCPTCGFEETAEKKVYLNIDPMVKKEPIVVVGEDLAEIKTMPTIKVECSRCGNKEAYYWFVQTRSGDEPTTQFFRCTKCGLTWRHYA
ncbi:MAG: transcription factor S [Candidatus Bathyarchaeota archaeon]|nr:transcription factor S [Candidatus Bathyarchaeota archaeon]